MECPLAAKDSTSISTDAISLQEIGRFSDENHEITKELFDATSFNGITGTYKFVGNLVDTKVAVAKRIALKEEFDKIKVTEKYEGYYELVGWLMDETIDHDELYVEYYEVQVEIGNILDKGGYDIDSQQEKSKQLSDQLSASSRRTLEYYDEIIIELGGNSNPRDNNFGPRILEEPEVDSNLPTAKPKGPDNCSENIFNCPDFDYQGDAQKLFDSCGGVSNDIHYIDGDEDGVACESLPIEGADEEVSGFICNSNYYNCGDFSSQKDAQSAFEACGGTSYDIHYLDGDENGIACESLP